MTAEERAENILMRLYQFMLFRGPLPEEGKVVELLSEAITAAVAEERKAWYLACGQEPRTSPCACTGCQHPTHCACMCREFAIETAVTNIIRAERVAYKEASANMVEEIARLLENDPKLPTSHRQRLATAVRATGKGHGKVA